MITAASALILVYLALMPFAWPALPGGVRVVDLVFPFIAILVVWTYGRTWRWTALDYCVVAYLLALLPSLLVTDDVPATSLELLKRGYLACVYVIFTIYFRAEGLRLAVGTLTVSTVVVCGASLGALLAYMLWGVEAAPALGVANQLPALGLVLRLRGGTDSSAMFGNYLTFVLPFLCAALAAGWVGRRAWVGQMLVVLAAMAFTLSHALAGFVVAALAMAWPLLRGYRPIARVAAVALTLLVVLAMNVVVAVAIRRIDVHADKDASLGTPAYHYVFQSPQGADRLSVQVSYGVMSYLLLKQVAWHAFLDRPLAGVGAGRFHAVTERAYQEGRIHEPYRASDPHSTLFGALAETGVLGTVTTVVLLLVALLAVRREETGPRRWVLLASYAAVLGLVVNSPNVDIMNFRYLWVGLAALRS